MKPAPRSARAEVTKRNSDRYLIAWLNPVTNQPVQIRIKHTRDYLAAGQDHIEIESIKPKRAALPVTETGYRSHFLPALELINAGGAVTFVTAWIDREARNKKWIAAETSRAQGDLFQWADTRREATGRKPSPQHAMASPRPRRRTVPDADHIADLEIADGQMGKRMAARERGKKPKPPRGINDPS